MLPRCPGRLPGSVPALGQSAGASSLSFCPNSPCSWSGSGRVPARGFIAGACPRGAKPRRLRQSRRQLAGNGGGMLPRCPGRLPKRLTSREFPLKVRLHALQIFAGSLRLCRKAAEGGNSLGQNAPRGFFALCGHAVCGFFYSVGFWGNFLQKISNENEKPPNDARHRKQEETDLWHRGK